MARVLQDYGAYDDQRVVDLVKELTAHRKSERERRKKEFFLSKRSGSSGGGGGEADAAAAGPGTTHTRTLALSFPNCFSGLIIIE